MQRLRILRALALLATAAVGILVAHELDYRLVVPDFEHRHDLLLRTGHGYLSRALFIALTAGLFATFATAALGYARERRGGGTFPMRAAAVRLSLIQSGGFVLLEAVERLIVGAPADDRLWLVAAVGVVVQVLVATAGAWLLALLDRLGAAVARVVRSGRAFPRPEASSFPCPTRIVPRRLLLAGSTGSRAPPVTVR